MLTLGSRPKNGASSRGDRRPDLADARSATIAPISWRFILIGSLGVGVVSFVATELLHYLLVPDLGRHQERLLAEGISAFIVTCLVAKLAHLVGERHRLTVARMQIIGEMNHHVRNALTSISLSADATEDKPLTRIISEGVARIDWALREILPREVPLRQQPRGFAPHIQTSRRGFK